MTKVNVPPLVIVQTPGVDEVKVGVKPVASVVAISVGVVPKFRGPGLAKVTVWIDLGVIELDALDAGPVPATLSAVTVKV